MTRLSIEISGPASDDAMAQAKVLIGSEAELTALVVKLGELGCRVTHKMRFIVEHERKPRITAPDPATQIAQERPADDVVVEHTKGHARHAAADAAERTLAAAAEGGLLRRAAE